VAAAFGPSFGSSTWMMCISDFAVMRKGATVAVSSPGLVSMALGEKVSAEDLGGWRLHSDITGLVDQVVDTEEQVFEAIRKSLSYLPSHHNEAPPDAPVPAGSGADMDKVFSILPESRTQVYDMKRVIRSMVDKDTMFELKPRFGKSAVTTLARLGGKSVGIVANNGVLFSESALKATHFIELCNLRGIPLLFLQNVTGFMVGQQYERGGIAKDGAKMVHAVATSVVPKFTVIIGGSFGAGNYGMCGRSYSPRMLFMWPNSRISVMGGDQAAGVLSTVKRDSIEAKGGKSP